MTLATAFPLSPPRSPSREHAEKRALPAIVCDALPFGTTDAVDIAFEVCDALASLHANGIVHGDLGPHCVKLAWPRTPGQRGDVEIFARAEREASGTIRVDGDGSPKMDRGPFVAPEQRRASAIVDARADIWAVGALLRWMLAGEARPRMLEQIVGACLSEDPAARPQTIDELAEKIAAFASLPPIAFERIAERRRKADDAARALARQEARDGRITLDRLEQLAVERERSSDPERLARFALSSNVPAPRLVIAEDDSAPDTLASAQMPVVDVDDEAEEITDDDDDDFVTIARDAPSPLASVPVTNPEPPPSDDRASWIVDKAETSDAYLAQLATEAPPIAPLLPTVEAPRRASALPWVIAAVFVTVASFVAVYAYLVLRPVAPAPADHGGPAAKVESPATPRVETPPPASVKAAAPADTTPTISAAALPDAPGSKRAIPTVSAAALPDAR